MAFISPYHADKLRMFGGLRQKGDGPEWGNLILRRNSCLGIYCNSKCWHRNVIPLYYPFHSAVETQFHKVRQWTIMLLRPIMKHALFFFFSTSPCDMNGSGNGTMQRGCTEHTQTIYNI